MGLTPGSGPSFAIVGNYGEGNLGDEALLASCIGLIRERWPTSRIHVFSDDPEGTARQFRVESSRSLGILKPKNLAVMALRGELRALLATIRNCDCLVLGGGELLRTDYGAWAVLTVFDRVLLAQAMGRPVLMLGVGAGKLEAKGLPFRLLRAGCKRAVIITREPESAAVLERAGLPGAESAPDLAFLLNPETPKMVLPTGPKVGFSFLTPNAVRMRGLDWMSRERVVAAGVLMLRAAADLGAAPVLISFNRSAHDDDAQIQNEILSAAGPGTGAMRVDEELTPAEVQGVLGQMDMVVGMRLHACVLALSMGTPVLALAYDSKVRKVMESMGQGDCVLSLAEIESAPAKLKALWDGRQQRRAALAQTMECERARFHRVLDRALAKVLPAWK